MKYVIAIVVSVSMWFAADMIHDDPARVMGNAIWWREMLIMAIGITISAILN